MFSEFLCLVKRGRGVLKLGVLLEHVLSKEAATSRVNVVYKRALHVAGSVGFLFL